VVIALLQRADRLLVGFGSITGLIESLSQGRSPGLRPLVLVGGNGSLLCQNPFLPMPLAT
jgi:hypothetical protein